MNTFWTLTALFWVYYALTPHEVEEPTASPLPLSEKRKRDFLWRMGLNSPQEFTGYDLDTALSEIEPNTVSVVRARVYPEYKYTRGANPPTHSKFYMRTNTFSPRG